MTRVVQFCRRVFHKDTADGAADADLLELFVQRRDEGAFDALVRRHGPMVLGVCRRLLRDAHDAEDAFQAVFLVLSRKADSVRPRARVGNWLYGVAVHTAQEARRAKARRRAKERQAGALRRADPGVPRDDELLALLDDEMNRLPERYRTVLVLCDLEQATRREAAQRLGCKEGTVASRLDRARRLLRGRLLRRELSLSIAALVAGLAAQTAEAAVPPSALAEAVAVAMRGVPRLGVAELAERVARTLWWRRLATRAGLTVVALLVLVTVPAVLFPFRSATPAPPTVPAPTPEPGPVAKGNWTALGLLREERLGLPVASLAFSPDGRLLAVGGGHGPEGPAADGAAGVGVVTVVEVDPWREVAQLQEGRAAPVTAVAFAPDGRRLAGASLARLHLWDTADRQELRPALELPPGGAVRDIAFSPDGRRLAVARSGPTACLFDLDRRAAVPLPALPILRLDFSAGGKTLGLLGPAAADRSPLTLQLWDIAAERELARWPLPGPDVDLCRPAPRGPLLAVAYEEKVLLLDRQKGAAARTVAVAGRPKALAFAPGGRNLAVALSTGETLLIDGRAGEIRRRYPADPQYPDVASVAFSPDGTLLAIGAGGATGGVVRLWRGPRTVLSGWGQVVNPDGDCDIEPAAGGLTVTVPATPHDLGAEFHRLNAPRVLQEVEGDFSVQVKVGGALSPVGAGAVEGRPPYQSGGLLVWGDDGNYLRLERAAMARGGTVQTFAAFEVRERGELRGATQSELAEGDAYLRLERRGGRFRAWVSAEGRQWTELAPLGAELPAKVRVGVAAINTAREPLALRFEDLRLSR